MLLWTNALGDDVRAPTVKLSALPAVTADERAGNPYRSDPAAVLSVGESAYSQTCSHCHGEAATTIGPAADLRLVGRYCNRVPEGELRTRCSIDADAYFLKTVREGKLRLGIRHMPAFEASIPSELAWAIQSFVESRRE